MSAPSTNFRGFTRDIRGFRGFRGFTMIELLLALVLTAMLTAALSGMIGQSARDREAMRHTAQQPRWVNSTFNQIELDLSQATYWAGTDDRLILIGLDHTGQPARIEYRWLDDSAPALLVREVLALTAGSGTTPEQTLLAVGAQGLRVGPASFGRVVSVESAAQNTAVAQAPSFAAGGHPRGRDGVSVIVDGVAVPLHGVGGQVELELTVAGAVPTTYRRKVVLR